MNKKKVIFLARDFPLPGGRSALIKNVIDNMKQDFDFKVICFENNAVSEYSCIFIQNKKKNKTARILYYYWKSYFILKNRSKQEKIDLLFCTGLSSLGGVIYSRIHSIPCVFNTSGIRLKKLKDKINYISINKEIRKKRFIFKSIIGYGLRKSIDFSVSILARKIVVPTDYLKKRIQNYYPYIGKKTGIIEEGINESKLHLFSREELIKKYFSEGIPSNVILFCRVEEEKFWERLKERLFELYPSALIILIESKRVMVSKGREMIESKISAKEAMQLSDLMLCIPGEEPHSTTVLESLYFRKPTFVSNVGWLNDQFKPYPDFIIPSLSIEEITNTIDKFYANRDNYEKRTLEVAKNVLNQNNSKITYDKYHKLFGG